MLPLLLLSCSVLIQARTIQFYIEPTQRVAETYVQQLVKGKIDRIEQGIRMTASVSLVFDGGYYVMVDTPSATNIASKEEMLKGIASRNIVPGQIQLVVTTHGHPDHFGQGNFFPNARHFFGSYEYTDDNYITTELKSNSTMRLTNNVELWNTPGHTSQDISVMVHNVPCCGIVAVVGDLFYSEQDARNGTEWFAEAWNPLFGKVNRDRVICYADYIIPGHGKLFKISEQMKTDAMCNDPNNNVTLPVELTSTSTTSTELVGSITSTTEEPTPTPTMVQTTTTTPARITVDQQEELETPPPEITNLVNSVNDAIPYVMNNVVQPAAQQIQENGGLTNLDQNVVAPVMESAAIQLAKLLKVNVSEPAPENSYPYTKYWASAFKKLANDVPQLKQVFGSYPKVLPFLDQAKTAAAPSYPTYLQTVPAYNQGG